MALALKDVDFEAIAYRGNSGALVAPAVAARMGKRLIMSRKPGENSHSSSHIEGPKWALRYVIVDDFVSTGRTINTIVDDVAGGLNVGSVCVGLVEYTKLPFYDTTPFRGCGMTYSIPRFAIRPESQVATHREPVTIKFDNGSTIQAIPMTLKSAQELVYQTVTGRTSCTKPIINEELYTPLTRLNERFMTDFSQLEQRIAQSYSNIPETLRPRSLGASEFRKQYQQRAPHHDEDLEIPF